jgi:uroporphyrinogen-III synthase
MKPVAILRPEPGASRTAAAASALGLEPVIAPLFRIEPLEWTPPDPSRFDGLLLTSANAVRQAGRGLDSLRDLRAYCVGEATAAAATEAGLQVAKVGTGGVESLLESLSSGLQLLHLCGRHRHPAPAGSVEAVPVYESVAVAAPPALSRLADAVLLVHSPRAGQQLRALADEGLVDRKNLSIAAISDEAELAAGSGWQEVEVAAEPTDSALLAIAARLCNKHG